VDKIKKNENMSTTKNYVSHKTSFMHTCLSINQSISPSLQNHTELLGLFSGMQHEINKYHCKLSWYTVATKRGTYSQTLP